MATATVTAMARMDDDVVVGDGKDATAMMTQWTTADDDGNEGWRSTQQ